MGRAAFGTIAACAVAAVLAGCGGGDGGGAAAGTTSPPTATAGGAASGSRLATPDPASGQMLAASGLSVTEIIADTTGEPLVALAYVVVAPGGDARLCEALAESSPPQCGGASIAVTGLPPEMVDGFSARGGVRWSDAPVQLIGTVRDGAFVNDPLALAAS